MMLNYFSIATFLLLFESPTLTHGFCETPPLGHLCRSMDLTGFCLQTSHIIPIRNGELTKPYPHMSRIFEKLETLVGGDKPFVHFGAYHQQVPAPTPPSPSGQGPPPPPPIRGRHQGGTYGMQACLIPKNCLTRPEIDAQKAASGGGAAGGQWRCTCPSLFNAGVGQQQGQGAAATTTAGPAPSGPAPAGPPPQQQAQATQDCDCECRDVPVPSCTAEDMQLGSAEQTPTPAGTQCHPDCRCCLKSPPTQTATRTIFSFQDACELKYLKSPVKMVTGAGASDLMTIRLGETAKENPYHLEVSEITVDGSRLHNWLHLKIYYNDTGNTFQGDFGKGKIKMAFIMVSDAMGYPVGEFVNDQVPCEMSCKCEGQNAGATDGPVCYQSSRKDAFPCMYEGMRVVSNTGMMMFLIEDDSAGKGLKEIHATWRFTQSRSPEHFHTELHFHALLVDDFTICRMHSVDNGQRRIGAISERTTFIPDPVGNTPPTPEEYVKEGVFGWNPIYTILHPTNETIGSYDYFREDVFEEQQINCHMPISPHHYVVEPYPNSGPTIKKVPENNPHSDHCYRFDNTITPNPSETANHCAPQGQTDFKRTPIKCPQQRTRVKPFYHDTYGFVVEGKTDPAQVYPWTLYGARSAAYVLRDGGLRSDRNWGYYHPQDLRVPKVAIGTAGSDGKFYKKLYFSAEHNESFIQYRECEDAPQYWGTGFRHTYPKKADKYEISAYGHFCSASGEGRRVPNLPGGVEDWPNYLAVLWKAPAVDEKSYHDDRCYCPTLPGTPNPRYKEPPEVQVQGRRQHAYQMIIAWNCIVPFSIFVSRYYKETFSKVYFLQEFWWYTTHVLCMVSAAMFTFGGIYVMELKRRDPINWLDPNITTHLVIGYVIIGMFFFQVGTGFVRVRDVKKRVFNIFMHWLFGVLEYVMAVACMINSAFILMSGMTCAGVIALGFLIVFQVLFYASMEVHMRAVDKQMKLNPPRSYLPPPLMRVFHKDAPDAKFRIYVLLAYLTLCVGSAIIQFSAMESNKEGESCFLKSSKYYERLQWQQQNG